MGFSFSDRIFKNATRGTSFLGTEREFKRGNNRVFSFDHNSNGTSNNCNEQKNENADIGYVSLKEFIIKFGILVEILPED